MDDLTKIFYRLPKYFESHPTEELDKDIIKPYYKISYDGNTYSITSNGQVNPPKKDRDLTILFETTEEPTDLSGVTLEITVSQVAINDPNDPTNQIILVDIPRFYHMTPVSDKLWIFRLNEHLAHYLKYYQLYNVSINVYRSTNEAYPGNLIYTFNTQMYKVNAVDSYFGNDIDSLYYCLNLSNGG